MGATDFECRVMIPEIGKAFGEARDHAAWEHGHGGYTGTIAEKHDYIVVEDDPRPLKEARVLAEEMMEDDDERVTDKWGPAAAIPLCRDEDAGRALAGWLFFGYASC